MANQLSVLTLNAAENSWVDLVPGEVSTGYQAQNTTIEAAYNGLDNSYAYYDSATDEIVIPPSGPIDNNGILLSVTSEIRLTVASAGDWYLRIVPGGTATTFSIELTSSKGTWDASKNALYDGSGRRVLNWKIVYNTVYQSVVRLHENGFSGEIQTFSAFNVNTNSMKLSPSSSVGSRFSSPSGAPSGITINSDTGNLISCDVLSDTVYVHDGISSSIITSFSSPSTRPQGLAFDRDNGNLISCDSDSDTIYVHIGVSSSILTSFSAPSTDILSITYDFDSGNLISVNNTPDTIYIHNGISSSILTTFAAPGSVTTGLAYDSINKNLISSSQLTPLSIFIHDGISADIKYQISPNGTSPQDATYDTVSGSLIIIDDVSDNIYIHENTIFV